MSSSPCFTGNGWTAADADSRIPEEFPGVPREGGSKRLSLAKVHRTGNHAALIF